MSNDSDIAYMHHSIAYGYACEVERLKAACSVASWRITALEEQIETMARDALTKEG